MESDEFIDLMYSIRGGKKFSFSKLIMWQWDKRLCKIAGHKDSESENIIRAYMSEYASRRHVTPVVVQRRMSDDLQEIRPTPLMLRKMEQGKLAIRDGHHRAIARKRLGYKSVPALVWDE